MNDSSSRWNEQLNKAIRALVGDESVCPYCGKSHPGVLCPRIAGIQFYPDGQLKGILLAGEGADGILPPVYALVNEAVQRHLAITPFANQLVAATALHQGKLVEMPTGEGKTLAAVFPAVLNALTGRGVHILTAND